jgi:hypothetical protein
MPRTARDCVLNPDHEETGGSMARMWGYRREHAEELRAALIAAAAGLAPAALLVSRPEPHASIRW